MLVPWDSIGSLSGAPACSRGSMTHGLHIVRRAPHPPRGGRGAPPPFGYVFAGQTARPDSAVPRQESDSSGSSRSRELRRADRDGRPPSLRPCRVARSAPPSRRAVPLAGGHPTCAMAGTVSGHSQMTKSQKTKKSKDKKSKLQKVKSKKSKNVKSQKNIDK